MRNHPSRQVLIAVLAAIACLAAALSAAPRALAAPTVETEVVTAEPIAGADITVRLTARAEQVPLTPYLEVVPGSDCDTVATPVWWASPPEVPAGATSTSPFTFRIATPGVHRICAVLLDPDGVVVARAERELIVAVAPPPTLDLAGVPQEVVRDVLTTYTVTGTSPATGLLSVTLRSEPRCDGPLAGGIIGGSGGVVEAGRFRVSGTIKGSRPGSAFVCVKLSQGSAELVSAVQPLSVRLAKATIELRRVDDGGDVAGTVATLAISGTAETPLRLVVNTLRVTTCNQRASIVPPPDAPTVGPDAFTRPHTVALTDVGTHRVCAYLVDGGNALIAGPAEYTVTARSRPTPAPTGVLTLTTTTLTPSARAMFPLVVAGRADGPGTVRLAITRAPCPADPGSLPVGTVMVSFEVGSGPFTRAYSLQVMGPGTARACGYLEVRSVAVVQETLLLSMAGRGATRLSVLGSRRAGTRLAVTASVTNVGAARSTPSTLAGLLPGVPAGRCIFAPDARGVPRIAARLRDGRCSARLPRGPLPCAWTVRFRPDAAWIGSTARLTVSGAGSGASGARPPCGGPRRR